MKILLLEDELMLSKSIRQFLHSCGHIVDVFDSGLDVLEAIGKYNYDFFILDINTPELSGLEALKIIALKFPHTPKIMISAYSDIGNISNAFRDGCDDYLKKPFDLEELKIRIDRLASKVVPIDNKNIQLSKSYAFNKDDGFLYYNGQKQIFTKKEYELISYFVTNIGRLITQDNIAMAIWGSEMVEDSTIRSLIKRVRAKLKEDIIQNVRGFGYTLQKYD